MKPFNIAIKKGVFFFIATIFSTLFFAQQDQKVYSHEEVDVQAIPPGGFMDYRERIKDSLNFPKSAAENGIAGRVTLMFIVLKTGQFGEVKVIHSKSDDCDNEAIRVLYSMGLWKPAQRENENVDSWVLYSFNFRREE